MTYVVKYINKKEIVVQNLWKGEHLDGRRNVYYVPKGNILIES